MRHQYFCSCIEWPNLKVQRGLIPMLEQAKEIRRSSFKANIYTPSLKTLEARLGYFKHHTQGLSMATDPHVKYFTSLLNGQRVYFLRHSAIEHVFTPNGEYP
jgi:hypothetical protein